MRGILFRAKNFDNGVWVQGYYVRLNGNKHFIYTGQSDVDCGNYYPDYYPVAAKTVGQFTGLTDKNGTKIFEGDILAIKFHPQYVNRVCWYGPPDAIAKVFWDFSGFRLNATNGKDRRYPALVDVNFKETEVIGNIHDNPELLKGGTDNDK